MNINKKDMKKFIVLAAITTFTTNLFAQFPIQDNFNHVDGAGEWTINHGFLYEDINMGAENGYLTYNMGATNYIDSRQYEYQSPDYTTLFNDCGCDSIKVTFQADINIRPLDQFKFFYISSTNVANFKIPTGAADGVYSYTLPRELKHFTLNLVTWGGGSTAGKYVKIDYFRIECVAKALPVELVSFDAKAQGEYNHITWETANEINSDFFTLEKSTDGVNYREINKTYTNGNSYTNKYYSYDDESDALITYYRLKQTDLNGEMKVLGIKSVLNDRNSNDKIIKIVNTLGQEVKDNFEGMKIYQFESGRIIKKA